MPQRAVPQQALRRRRPHRVRTFFLVLAAIALVALLVNHLVGSSVSPLRARIVAAARGQLGYRTDPPTTYCNRFSAYWYAGVNDCGNANRDEQWCADFAAWVWKQAGAEVTYKLAPGYLNSDSASFYVWGVDHGTWHPVSSGYTPQPGDVAVYGLNLSSVTADHVAIVTAATSRPDAPDVINGDGDRTGFSVVETGTGQEYADVHGRGGRLSGYVSPLPSSPS
jgi:CHAP domain